MSDGQMKKTASNVKLRRYLPNFTFTPLNEGQFATHHSSRSTPENFSHLLCCKWRLRWRPEHTNALNEHSVRWSWFVFCVSFVLFLSSNQADLWLVYCQLWHSTHIRLLTETKLNFSPAVVMWKLLQMCNAGLWNTNLNNNLPVIKKSFNLEENLFLSLFWCYLP